MHYSGYKLDFEAFKKISRLMDVKLIKTSFDLIDKYYEQDEIEYLPHSNLNEAYSYLDSFCSNLAYMNPNKNSTSGNIFEDNEKYLMYKYIYASKGSEEALARIKTLTGVNIELSLYTQVDEHEGQPVYGEIPRHDYGVYNRIRVTFPKNKPIDYSKLVAVKSDLVKLVPDIVWRTDGTLTVNKITVDNVIIEVDFYNNNQFKFSQKHINHVILEPRGGELT